MRLDSFGFQGGGSGGGGGGLTELVIENTLYVSKNGDDGTGLRNRLDKPFLTITAASAVAVAGDLVVIEPGVYDEGTNDIIKSDVHYDFKAGADITCTFECISDFGVAKNIYVYGEGIFRITGLNFAVGTVSLVNAASTIYFRGKQVYGTGQAINITAAATFDIKFDYATCTSQYTVNVRGNSEGTIEFGEINNQSTGVAVMFRNLGTDLVARKIFLKGQKITGISSGAGQGLITTINTNNTETYMSDFTMENTTGVNGGLFYFWTGKNFMRNITGYAVSGPIGYGVLASTNTGAVHYFENCNLVANQFALFAQGDHNVSVENCQLVGKNDTPGAGGAVTVDDTAQLSISDTMIAQDSTVAARKCINVLNSNLRLRNCKLVGNPIQTESIGASGGAPQTLYVELQCVATKPVNGLMTNGIAGTNIVVDANVARNTNNFFS
jgi:hypothetical protein